jgi:hypothetical protein
MARNAGDYFVMRPIMLTLVLSLLSGSQTLAQGFPPPVQAPWWQLCGNRPSLPFDPHFSCCCHSPIESTVSDMEAVVSS